MITHDTTYEDLGYLANVEILPSAAAVEFRKAFNAMLSANSINLTSPGFSLHDRHLDKDFIWEVATAPVLLDIVQRILGPDILLLGTRFVCKPPHSDLYVPWHQDGTYIGLVPPTVVNVWMAVDDTDVDNGCLRMLPRRAGHSLFAKRSRRPIRSVGNLVDFELDLDESETSAAAPIPLSSGRAVLFAEDVIHGSEPSRSQRRRCALAMRFAPSDSRLVNRGQWAAVVVRGHARSPDGEFVFTREKASHFDYRPPAMQFPEGGESRPLVTEP